MTIYYLLYKLNNNKTYWIVDIDENEVQFYIHCKDYVSNHDKYLIVEREVSNLNGKITRKQFEKFIFTKHDTIVKVSKSKKINKFFKLFSI